MKTLDITGRRYGLLTAIEKVLAPAGVKRNMHWRCACDCGAETVADVQNLNKGRTQSCGCGRSTLGVQAGDRFGMLVLTEQCPQDKRYWFAKCDCGTSLRATASNIAKGATQSCGCFRKKRTSETKTTHSQSWSARWVMLCNARQRSKKSGVPFSLSLNDIPEVPEVCPLLGIPIIRVNGKKSANSPSLDRKVPALGYVAGNIQIISYKANTIKNNATFAEFERIYLNWKASQGTRSTTQALCDAA